MSAALVTVSVLVALFLIICGFSSYQTGSARRAWAETVGSKQQLLERFPTRGPSASALRLEELTPALGIVTEARHRMQGRAPRDMRTAAFSEIKPEMMRYAKTQFAKTERGIDPPPEIVVAYLERQAGELTAVRELILESEELHWEMELERMFAAPIPNLLGHLDLVKLLLVDALVALDRGERTRALADMGAVWKLSRGLHQDPMLITQLIVMVDVRMLTGVLRQFPDAPPVWRRRLAEDGYRRRFIDALEIDAWVLGHAPIDLPAVTDLSELVSGLVSTVGRPYMQYCMAQASDAFREQVQNLKRVPAICDYDLSLHHADLTIDLPPWNVMGEIMVPNLTTALGRVARLELDLELTRAVLDLDAGLMRSANTSSSIRSDACPQDAWLHDRSARGRVELSLSRKVEWKGLRGHDSPQRFTFQLHGGAPSQESI